MNHSSTIENTNLERALEGKRRKFLTYNNTKITHLRQLWNIETSGIIKNFIVGYYQ